MKTWKLGLKNQIFLEKTEVDILIPINWFDSCNDSFFDGMKLTLHKSQVHSYRLCSDMSLQFNHDPSFACRGGCERRERIILLLVFIA